MRARAALVGALVVGTAAAAQPGDRLPALDTRRLDPHGPVEIDFKKPAQDGKAPSECKVCHQSGAGRWPGKVDVKPDVGGSCASCHGKSPHGGVAEHMGREWRGKAIGCLDCHSPHRHGSKNDVGEPSALIRAAIPNLPSTDYAEFKDRPAARQMLVKTCVECHR